MTLFWILVGVMTLAALAFVVPPLVLAGNSRPRDRDQVNAEVIREQLRELRADLEAGRLDAPAHQAARQDLERELLDNLDGDAADSRGGGRSGHWIGVGLIVVMPVLALLVYQQIGAPGIVPRLDGQGAFRTQSPGLQGHSVVESVNALAERLERQPDNLEGWMLLGRSYAAMGRDRDAAEAYARARMIDAGEAEP
ncbi:MAG TPA: c-type cytochrome biogenesis protein CcmI [Thiohalobacter sp.]|nr:c-type cytochrome biogenesis protein CcmI [Thiohalobacter sp.]